MIEFAETQDRLELIYEAEFGPSEWVERELERSGEVRIARTFHFSKNDLLRRADETDDRNELEEANGSYTFALGALGEGYFKIAGAKLGIEHDVYLAAELPISSRTFIAHRNISIFRQIARVTAEDIYIGGDKPNAMPVSDFEKLLSSFPNSTELDRYPARKLLESYENISTPPAPLRKGSKTI